MKKKIFSIALLACVIVLSIAGASVAYFTDTDEKTNVFTAGNVDIELDDNVFTTLSDEDETVYPGQQLGGAATIRNVGSEDAFIGAIISFTKNIGEEAKVKALFTGLVANGTDYTVKYDSTEYKLYIVKTAKLNGKNDAVTDEATLFNGIAIPAAWGNTEMSAFNGVQISVKAYATQTVGFGENNTAANALVTAFATDWADFASLS
ncbi:MAG: hypothetical protein J6J66_08295 [Clostridia bacterium]|nr:hypothetical protein [Clostridia bacterium]